MCTNYAPVQRQLLRDVYGVEPPLADWKPETWPDYWTPIVRADQSGARNAVLATFGAEGAHSIRRQEVRHNERQVGNGRGEAVFLRSVEEWPAVLGAGLQLLLAKL